MSKKIDLTGQKFGRLLVSEQANNLKTPNGRSHVAWNCICDCGNKIIVRGDCLRNGHTVSCGCKQRENRLLGGKSRILDLVGKRFGKLTVIKDSGNRSPSGDVIWLCQCDCGNQTNVIGNNLTRKKYGTISCGCSHSQGEEKISQILIQSNIPFEYQKTFDNCIFPDTNRRAKFDFYIDNFLLLEYDGEQHFACKNSGWNTKENFEIIKKHDSFKNQWCKDNNILLARIPYTDFELISREYIIQLLTHYGYKEIR